MNNFKKRAKIGSTLILAFFILSGCSFEQGLDSKLEWLDGQAGRLFEEGSEDKTVIEAMESGKTKQDKERDNETSEKKNANSLTSEEKSKIDKWLDDQGYNRYGDAGNAVYMGGTPLFNEQTGQAIDRYDYILNKFPNILERIAE